MQERSRRAGFRARAVASVIFALPISASAAFAQESDVVQNSSKEEAPAAARPEPLRGPKLLNLRYDEDFSYLDGPEGSYEPDFFDPIKNIRLGDDWRLTLGGELKFRGESHTNFAFGARDRTQDTFQLYRYMLHADLKYRETFRIFLQGAVMHEEDRAFGPRPIDENHLALHQAFFDWQPSGESAWTLRVGRQELSYGAQRFVSPLEWANTRRRFDAAKLIWELDHGQFDFFYSKPVPVNRNGFDDNDEDFDFWGAYWTSVLNPHLSVDVFAFAVDDRGSRTNPNGRSGDVSRFTLGSRLYGKKGGFDYEAVLAGQWGSWAGDNIEAWAWTLDGGYTVADFVGSPRIGLGFDWASGDRDPTDGTVETFDQLFPLGHKYLGFMDFIGRQNIQAANVNFAVWAVPKKVKARVAYHAFWLASEDDALYAASGAASRRDPTGSSGKEVGRELDVTLHWKIDVHSSVLIGYSHFFDGGFLQDTGSSEDADFVYVQYQMKF